MICTMAEQKTIDPGASRLETLRALSSITASSGRVPSLAELARARYLSIPGVKKQLDWMAAHGLVERPKGAARSVVLTDAGRSVLRYRR